MNDRPPGVAAASQNRDALKIAGLYLLIGGLWILFSDKLALMLTHDPAVLSLISLFKGWGYIVVTALLLYWLIRRHTNRLRESEAHYRSLFQHNHSVMLLIDPQSGAIVDANPSACAFYGYTHPEITRLKITDLNQLTPAQVFAEMERAKQEQRKQFFFPHRLASGEVREVEVYSGPIKFQDKTLLYSIIHDITERKRVEEALRESESNFRNLFKNMTEGVAVHEMIYDERNTAIDYRILLVNPAYEKYTGLNQDQIDGKFASELYGTESPPYLETYAQVASSDQPCFFETFFPPMNKHFSISVSSPKRGHFVTVFEDITERKQAEAQLRQSEQRYRLLHETMTQGVVHQDAAGTIISMNPAAEQILGKTMAEFLGQSSVSVEHDTLREDGSPFPGLEHPSMVALRTGQQVRNVVMQVYNPKERQYRWITITAVPLLREGEDSPYQVYTTFDDITERKRAEEALRQSQDNFARAFNSSPAALAITRLADGKFLSLNEAYSGIMGYQPVEILGRTAAEMNIYVNSDERDQLMQQLREQGAVRNYELLVRHKSGEVRSLLVAMEPTLYNHEKAIISTFLDMTERKQAEESIRESEQLLRAVTNTAQVGLVIVDQEHSYRYANPAYATIFHLPTAEIVGRRVADVLAPVYETQIRPRLERAFAGEQVNYELTVPPAMLGGEERRYAVTYEPGVYHGAKVVVVVVTDITERKQAEVALQRSVDRLWVLADASRAFAEVGTEYQVLLDQVVRKTTERLAEGCTISLLSDDKEWLHLAAQYDVDPEKREFLRLVISQVPLRIDEPSLSTRVIQSRQPLLIPVIDPAQVRATTKPEYWSLMERVGIHSIIGVPMRVQGQVIGALLLHRHRREQPPFEEQDLALAQDLADRASLAISNVQMLEQLQHELTERKRAQEELEQTAAELARSNTELEQFAYIASHDLQEPLRAVAGTVQLLQKRYGGQLDTRADEFIQHALDGTSRMQTLISDLLAFSRVGTRGQPFQPTNCMALLKDVLANLSVAIRESNALITHDNLPTVMADRTQLGQLFQNLIGNAIKFRGDKAPVIHLGLEAKENEYLFSVRDRGIGLESQYFERIFGVFQRLHTRREYAGTGIGLAVCKKIVERHGGRIWVESEPGQGAAFYFTLPKGSHQ